MTTSPHQPTCAERVNAELESRIDDLTKLWNAYCAGDENAEDLGYLHEYGLCFDYVTPDTFSDQEQGYFRYQLSYGGPSDEFRFYVGAELTPYKIEYWFLDWYDGAHRTLICENKLFMLTLFNWFKECGAVEAQFQKATEDAP